MNSEDEKVIGLSKKKILLLVLGSCVFVVLGAWLFLLDPEMIQSLNRFNNSTLIHGTGLASMVFFGACGVFAIKKLFDSKAGLVFNSAGVIDNSSAVSAGLIPWSEIAGAEIFEIHKQKMLIIKVRNPQKYIEHGGKLRRALNNANYKMCGSPIAITSSSLKIDFSELLSLFHQYKQKYGNG